MTPLQIDYAFAAVVERLDREKKEYDKIAKDSKRKGSRGIKRSHIRKPRRRH